MTRSERKFNEEDQPHSEPLIEDLRHSRDLESEPEEPLTVPEPPPPAPPAAAVEPTLEPAPNRAPAPQAESAAELPPEEVAEMDQLRQIFGAGIVSYLRSQLGMLINFAVVYLGRASNPATGLVGADLPKAKLTIDLLEAITSLIQAEMSAAERTELGNILAELKYSFLQSAAGSPQSPAPSGEA